MRRLFKFLFFLILLAGIGFVIYAYVGPVLMRADFEPPTQRVSETVTLEID